jgi:hypothetical protein
MLPSSKRKVWPSSLENTSCDADDALAAPGSTPAAPSDRGTAPPLNNIIVRIQKSIESA